MVGYSTLLHYCLQPISHFKLIHINYKSMQLGKSPCRYAIFPQVFLVGHFLFVVFFELFFIKIMQARHFFCNRPESAFCWQLQYEIFSSIIIVILVVIDIVVVLILIILMMLLTFLLLPAISGPGCWTFWFRLGKEVLVFS